jgi:hypothetical protein
MRRVALVLLIPSLVAPLAARQQAPPPPAASPERVPQTVGMTGDEIADLNRRIRTFQAAVHSAIENGGSRLADRAEKLVQGAVELAMNGTPRINPVYIPGTGFHYDVQVPDILGTSFAMWSYLYKRQQQQAIPLAGRPPDERVTANSTVVKADTMVADTNFDPNTEYATFVRQELIEAMLESSTVLPIKSDEKLIISARVPAEAQANVLSHYKRIVLQIHGSDLQAYRQGQLTKDQVKERVLEFRY